MRIRSTVVPVFLVLSLLARLESAGAQADSTSPFFVRPVPPNTQLFDEASTGYVQLRAVMDKANQALQTNALGKFRPNELGQIHVGATRLILLGRRLAALGETAGVDFEYRGRELITEFGKVSSAYINIPQAMSQIRRDLSVVQREAKQREASLPKVAALIEQGNWSVADLEIVNLTEDFASMAVWFTPQRRAQVMAPFQQAAAQIERGLLAQLKEQGLASLAEHRQANTPDFQGLLQQLASVSTSIGQTGSAEIDGKPHTGPEVCRWALSQWEKCHVQALRCQGIDRARVTLDASLAGPITSLPREYEDFSGKFAQAIADVIRADAARLDAAEIPAIHTQYLAVLAKIVIASDGKYEKQLAGALDDLVEKSPTFAEKVQQYRELTTEVLRWRQRVAHAQAAAKKTAGESTTAVATEAWRAEGSSWLGLLPTRAEDTKRATLNASVPALLPRISEKLVGKSVQLEGVSGLGSSPFAGIGRYQDRLYAQVGPGQSLSEQSKALATDLFVPGSPPLTLEAAVALVSAKQGSVVAVGGQIQAVYLESVTGRLGALPVNGGCMCSLGSVAETDVSQTPLRSVLMRLKIAPQWVQHRYFFIDSGAAASR